jgi:hypothetical protein
MDTCLLRNGSELWGMGTSGGGYIGIFEAEIGMGYKVLDLYKKKFLRSKI